MSVCFFGGVSFRARVYLDGLFLAEHYGAYTGFGALALGIVRGKHRLRVETDNRFGEDSALHIPNDYYAYGGINRPVILEELGDAYIAQCHITPCRTQAGWMARAAVTVRNLTDHPMNGTLSLAIAENRQEMESAASSCGSLPTFGYRRNGPCAVPEPTTTRGSWTNTAGPSWRIRRSGSCLANDAKHR